MYHHTKGTVVGRKRKINESKVVPLTRRSSQKLNYIQRNRWNAIENAIEKSSEVDKSPKQPRRSKRIGGSSKASNEKKRNRELSPTNLRRSSRFQQTLRYAGMERSEK